MRVLIIGSGGREHALAWKLSQECEVFCTPGNPGIATVATCFPVPASDIEGVLGIAADVQADLVLIGPEDPLIAGLADALRAKGYLVFGPNQDGARLEGSKAWSKDQMLAAGVPTAKSVTVTSEADAQKAIHEFYDSGQQVAVKASGAALGKGVAVCSTREEALDAVQSFLVRRELGEAGATLVLEQRLFGREFSLLTFVNGASIHSLPVAQDYKRIFDEDKGPNTGGMGTFAPAGWISPDVVRQTEETVVEPLIRQLQSQGIDYRGVLFSGLMVEPEGPMCLEYNVRFGDPETQSVMRVLGAGLLDALVATAKGELIPPVQVLDQSAVTVVMASRGYPESSQKGVPISIGSVESEVVVFHAGTATKEGKLVTNGGRVLGVSATGSTQAEARAAAYRAVDQIQFDGAQFRSDIATI